MEKHVKHLVVTALAIALTYVFTAFVNIRLPIMANGGLIHLGNVPLFVFAIIFGKKTGAIAGGIGMALFDLLSGWTAWAPFTLVVVGAMGYVVGAITEKKHSFGWTVTAMLSALVIKIGGYYIAEGIIYGNWAIPVASIPGNVVQVMTAMIIVMIIIVPLRKAANRSMMKE
ncbi:MAG: ECF transporter S component [Lachnospiraceae bacterium]|nr:ECF transporter S component [Lachnospiraceae bacterium]